MAAWMPLCVPLVHTTCQLLLTLSRAVNAAFLVIAGGAKAIKGTGCAGSRTKSGETIQTSGSRHTNSPCPSPVVRLTKARRSEEHTSELQSLMRLSYAVFCLT